MNDLPMTADASCTADLPHRLADLAHAHARRRPASLALRQAGRDWTWAQLADRVDALAHGLLAGGVRPGDRLAWLGLNDIGQIALLLALARVGAALVPLNHRLAPAEWRAVLADCQPVRLLHDAAFAEAAHALADALPGGAGTVGPLADADRAAPVWPGGGDAAAAAGSAAATVDPHAPVLLVYTSGTTGQPKGAVHTQANLMANMAAAVAVQGLAPGDRVLTVLPLFHVGGLCIQTLPALAAGACVTLHARFDAGAMLAEIADWRPTLTLVVPAVMQALIAHPQWATTDLGSLRAVWAGSSLLPPEAIEAFHARGVPVCNVYGATETGPFSIALGPDHAMGHVGDCGWPAPGVQARLAQPGADGVGEVWLRGAAIVRHYWPERPALDADGWFHTGDLARVDASGCWRIVGRAKDMIISGGENIYPAEVEAALATHPRVAECAVVGVPDARWGETPVAFVVLREAQPATAPPGHGPEDWESALALHLLARLARYKHPRRWVRVDALPRTALGKVRKPDLIDTLSKT